MKIAIVGPNGAIGQELIKLLKDQELLFFPSNSSICFKEIDLAFFCVGEERAKELIPLARLEGTICIDSSSAFRMDTHVPLVIPEINGHLLNDPPGIISSPNCTTTLMLLPLASLHHKFGIKRIVASTYQAVSGAGKKGIEELRSQTEAFLENKPIEPSVFPYPCAFNIFPHESELDSLGYAKEERKMEEETKKILHSPEIGVTARCIRVPVFRAHSLSLNVEFLQPFDLDEAIDLIQTSPGVEWKENPLPIDSAGKNQVCCGRVRLDHTQPNTLEMWIVGDQLLKGGALNMCQIFERVCLNLPNKIENGGSLLQ